MEKKNLTKSPTSNSPTAIGHQILIVGRDKSLTFPADDAELRDGQIPEIAVIDSGICSTTLLCPSLQYEYE